MTHCTCVVTHHISLVTCKNYYLLFISTILLDISSFCNQNLEISQEENLKLKELKAQLGQPLSWSDYLSLPFTQSVS
jgi:hypothetical protein